MPHKHTLPNNAAPVALVPPFNGPEGLWRMVVHDCVCIAKAGGDVQQITRHLHGGSRSAEVMTLHIIRPLVEGVIGKTTPKDAGFAYLAQAIVTHVNENN